MSLLTCNLHGYYASGFGTCPECGNSKATLQTPQAGNVGSVVRRKSSRKREAGKPKAKPARGAIKPLNPVTAQKRLQVAGLTDVSMIVSGLQTGAVAGALYAGSSGNAEGVFLRYVAIVDSLSTEYPQVAKYRNRLVSGVAA